MPANAATSYVPRLKSLYKTELRAKLREDLKLANLHEVPSIEKIVLNVGTGRIKEDNRARELVINTLTKITGQQPIETVAKQSIAGFKLREGQKIGVKVTLRGERMYEFLDRLINIILPRVRDFHGVSRRGFDKAGNYNFGLVEQSIFPELGFDEISSLHGIQITIVIKNGSPEASQALLSAYGMPFEKARGKK